MKNKNSKIAIVVAVLFEVIIIITAILRVLSGDWKKFFLLTFAMIAITVPFIITYIFNKKKINLPSKFQLSSVIFIWLALYLGESIEFYSKFWWWDLFLHGTFGIGGVIAGLSIMKGIITKAKDVSENRFNKLIIILAFSFSITLGTLWEMFEFLSDYFFNTKMADGGLEDTATDLLIKILFATITSITYYYRKKKAHT